MEAITVEDRQLVSNALLCQAFKGTPMFDLLDAIMEALERDALNKLSDARTSNKEELFALTLRWQERKFMRQDIKDQIEQTIADARQLVTDIGLDPDEWEITNANG